MASTRMGPPRSEQQPAPGESDTPATTPASPGEAEGATAEPTAEQLGQAALLEASLHHPFGPAFFMTQLRGFADEKCPDPALERPAVEIHLGDGEVLDLCHIIGVTPNWVALAVLDGDRENTPRRMRTEFVPFAAIARVTLRGSRPESPHLGFEHGRVPQVLSPQAGPEMTPEAALRAAAAGGTEEPRGD